MKRGRSQSQCLQLHCPRCEGNLDLKMGFIYNRCAICSKTLELLKCITCDFQKRLCRTCDVDFLKSLMSDFNSEKCDSKSKNNIKCYYLIFAIVVILSFIILTLNNSGSSKTYEHININGLMKNLKTKYPSQKPETWYHFLSVLDKKIPSVKSITFLYSENKKTSDCLLNELVFLFSDSKNVTNKEMFFSNVGFEGGDYGLALEHYRAVVRKFRVFIADLTHVSGNLARIFHSLCDEVSSDIKPSLFIFSLKYDKKFENLKPLERMTTILQENWSDLPDSELFPLLSRVVKNVIEIIPETISC